MISETLRTQGRKFALIAGFLVVGVVLFMLFGLRWVVVDPGYTGIKINRLVILQTATK